MHKNNARSKLLEDLRFIARVVVVTLLLCAAALEFAKINASERPASTHSFSVSHSLPAFLVPDVHVSQGDRIYVMDSEDSTRAVACTVGYVDIATRVIQTAGHCFDDGSEVYTEDWKLVGVGSASDEKDAGYIQPKDNVELIENAYSTDAVDHDGVNVGDEVCIYGSSSKTVRCDVVTGTGKASTIDLGVDGAGIRGDSGGPAWTVDGYIGTYSGSRKNADTGETVGGYVTIS